jgi:hypothetical protein
MLSSVTALDFIVAKLVSGVPVADSISAYAREAESTIADAIDLLAVEVAQGFLGGSLTWAEGDRAANLLWDFMQTPSAAIPDLAYAIFDAFDQGEYHREPGDDPVATYTRPLLRAALGAQDI